MRERVERYVILAVADSLERDAMRKLFESGGHPVASAGTAKEVLSFIETKDVTLVVIDSTLPDLSGYELCRTIREKFPEEHFPIILLRAQNEANKDWAMKSYLSGATLSIARPYELSDLVARADAFIRAASTSELRESHALEKKVETQHLEIRRLRDLNREIVAAIPSIIIVLDSALRIVFANTRLTEVLQIALKPGETPHIGEIFGKSFPRREELLSRIEEVKRTGIGVEMRDALFLAGPMERRVSLNIWVTRMGEPGSEQLLVVMEDVTEAVSRRDVVSMLRNVAASIQGTLDLEKILFTVLTCATAGVAIGFSRAFLFLVNEKEQTLEGKMGVGPESLEDAIRIWSSLGKEEKTLDQLVSAYDAMQNRDRVTLQRFMRGIKFRMKDISEVPVRAINERRTIVVRDASKDVRVSTYFRQKFGSEAFVCVPMIARNRPLGVVIADNMYSNRPVTDDKVELLEAFVSQAALAVDNAEAYEDLQDKVERLAKAYEALQSAQEKLIRTEQLAAIGDMAARVAHEIRNPLVTIGGFARAINRAPERPNRVKSNSWIIVQEVERLERILSGIMNFAKPQAPVFENNNINRIVDDTVLLAENEPHPPDVKIVKELDESIPLVTVDGAQIKQVLINLIHNAVAALEGEGIVSIKTRLLSPDWFEVSVSDTGRGIPDALRDKLFVPFFTTRSAGTGLGLPIAKKIIEDHNGTISFESKVGEGTTFVIKLPVHQ